METFPQKIRDLVLDGYEDGLTTVELCGLLKVSPAWGTPGQATLAAAQVPSATVQKHGPDPLLTAAHRIELAGLVSPDARRHAGGAAGTTEPGRSASARSPAC